MFFLSFVDIFPKITFSKYSSGKLSELQTVWFQIRVNVMSVLILIQTVCKDYQKMTKDVDSKERVNKNSVASMENLNHEVRTSELFHRCLQNVNVQSNFLSQTVLAKPY